MKKANLLVLVALVLTLSSGCAAGLNLVLPAIQTGIGGGNIVSGQQKAVDQCTVKLNQPVDPSTFVDNSMRIGKDLGYEVNNVDRRKGVVTLLGRNNRFEAAYLGKNAHQVIRLSLQEGGTEVDVKVDVSGNFGQGSQEVVGKILNDFKAKLGGTAQPKAQDQQAAVQAGGK